MKRLRVTVTTPQAELRRMRRQTKNRGDRLYLTMAIEIIEAAYPKAGPEPDVAELDRLFALEDTRK